MVLDLKNNKKKQQLCYGSGKRLQNILFILTERGIFGVVLFYQT